MADNKTFVIGVSGGIGSGKSSVTEILGQLGAEVVDADLISHAVTQGNMPAVYEIAAAFGDQFVDMYGRLNRSALAKHVFGDREKLDKLEAIVHKYVVAEMIARVSDFRNRGTGVMVLDVPIPVKHGFLDLVDQVWIVDADREIRIDRVIKRSNITRQEAESRMASQLSPDEYISLADLVIPNNGTLQELRNFVSQAALNIK